MKKSPLIIALFALNLIGCSASVPPDPLFEVGAKQFPNDKYIVFSVPAENPEEAESFIRDSTLYGGSPTAARLAELLILGETNEIRIVVGGPSSGKTAQVVRDALKLTRGHTLGGLVLLFVGEQRDAALIRKDLEPKLGTLLN